MIEPQILYGVTCDRCGETLINSNDNSAWYDRSTAEEEASEEDWHSVSSHHYCPNCYREDDDGNRTIKSTISLLCAENQPIHESYSEILPMPHCRGRRSFRSSWKHTGWQAARSMRRRMGTILRRRQTPRYSDDRQRMRECRIYHPITQRIEP